VVIVPIRRSRGPVSRSRWLTLVALAVTAVVATGMQLTSAALLPPEKTTSLAGVAAGLVVGSFAVWLQRRRYGAE
jgi:hypothetical protein